MGVAQQVKAIVAKPDNLSLIPGHQKERTNSSIQALRQAHVHTHVHTIIKWAKIFLKRGRGVGGYCISVGRVLA